MGAELLAVEADFRDGVRRPHFEIAHPVTRLQRLGVDATGAEIAVFAVLSVDGVPSVRKIDITSPAVEFQPPFFVEVYPLHNFLRYRTASPPSHKHYTI